MKQQMGSAPLREGRRESKEQGSTGYKGWSRTFCPLTVLTFFPSWSYRIQDPQS